MLVKKQTIGCYTATTKAGPCAKVHRVEVRRGQAGRAERNAKAHRVEMWGDQAESAGRARM